MNIVHVSYFGSSHVWTAPCGTYTIRYRYFYSLVLQCTQNRIKLVHFFKQIYMDNHIFQYLNSCLVKANKGQFFYLNESLLFPVQRLGAAWWVQSQRPLCCQHSHSCCSVVIHPGIRFWYVLFLLSMNLNLLHLNLKCCDIRVRQSCLKVVQVKMWKC